MATKTEVSNHFARQMSNIVAFVALVIITVCAGTIPFNDNYLMDVICKYNPDFMVAAYAWYVLHIVIYVFLLCFVIYQALSYKRNDRVIRSIDLLFCVFVLASIFWTFGFFYEVQTLALIGMIVAATTAFLIYHRLGIGKEKVSNTHYWCVHFPFSLIAAATIFGVIAEVSIFCLHYDLVWWGVGQTAWNVIAILVIGFVGSVFLQLRPDVGFGVALVWLSVGAAVYQNNQSPMISAFTYLLVLFFALLTYFNGMHRPRMSKKDTK